MLLLFRFAAISRRVCVWVGGILRTYATIAKNPLKLFYSRVSAGARG